MNEIKVGRKLILSPTEKGILIDFANKTLGNYFFDWDKHKSKEIVELYIDGKLYEYVR